MLHPSPSHLCLPLLMQLAVLMGGCAPDSYRYVFNINSGGARPPDWRKRWCLGWPFVPGLKVDKARRSVRGFACKFKTSITTVALSAEMNKPWEILYLARKLHYALGALSQRNNTNFISPLLASALVFIRRSHEAPDPPSCQWPLWQRFIISLEVMPFFYRRLRAVSLWIHVQRALGMGVDRGRLRQQLNFSARPIPSDEARLRVVDKVRNR